jgi:N-acetylmuramoyl-L-alanine amidase
VPVLLCLAGCGAQPKPPPQPGPSSSIYSGHVDLSGIDPSLLRGRRILIDPGHGGRFGGSTGQAQTRESDVNLGVALFLWGLLRDAGADVHLTRHSDRDFAAEGADAVRDDLAARVAILDSVAPDVFLSLHHNSNAALDRERNAIETYYKLDDDGPSYDLGRAIHAELVRHLGIAEARLRPGNYFVLRGARTAAVLGEASYLSNPGVESKLRLAEVQRLEAAAYFRGLAAYFEHGVAAIDKRVPAGDTLRVDSPLAFAVGAPVDPASVEVRAGSERLSVRLDDDQRGFVARGALSPGAHAVEARARLARGNAARPWRGTLVVHAPAAQAHLVAEPAAAPPGARVRLRARILDAGGRSVEDGTPVAWQAEDATIVDADSAVAGGDARAVAQLRGAAPRVHVASGPARASQRVTVAAGAAAPPLVRCLDARDARPLGDVWGGDGQASDRRGWLAAASAGELRVERAGYQPWRGTVPADATVRLQPLHGGVLHGVRFVVDPAGDGGDPALAGATFAAADVDHDVATRFAAQLAAAGAHAALTRELADAATDLDRVRRATGADWFVRIEATADADAPAALHYPGSVAGARLAESLAAAIGRRGGSSVAVRTDTRFVLQQTPCPAVWVRLPAARFATLDARRDLAYALAAGARVALDPEAARWPPLVGHVEGARGEAVSLDGADIVPVPASGPFRFEHVAPGPHRLVLIGDTPRSVEVTASGQDTTRAVIR